MDAYEILENNDIPDPIDEEFFDQLRIRFKKKYLKEKDYAERIALHHNPFEVKREVQHELFAYLQKIANREDLRDIDNKKSISGHVPTRVKEIWEADKRLRTDFEAIKKYCLKKGAPLNIIAVHMAEYLAMNELVNELGSDINNGTFEPLLPARVWDINQVEKQLEAAFDQNSELLLLEILKKNSFLFYELYERKYAIQPVFYEINLGAKLRCDFAWLNDNSDGPEWVLIEVEKPRMRVFSKNGKPTSELNDAIEQVNSWDRYFKENPAEKKRIFGAVSRFRFILVAGDRESWSSEKAAKWRAHHNADRRIDIRSTDTFTTSLSFLKSSQQEFWSFEKNPISLPFATLEAYWQNYGYMDTWRKIFN